MKAGSYGSASDVVRAGPQLVQDHETKVEALGAVLIEGEESEEMAPFYFEAIQAPKTG